MRTARYSRTMNKPLAMLLAVALCLAVMMGGALAWTDFAQSKTNKFHGTADADATLHDEFDGENKDIFVENSGTGTIFVRVRMDEFMMVGETVFSSGADIKDKTSWTPHTFGGTDMANCGSADIGKFHDYYTWELSGRERDYKPGVPGMVYTALGADDKVDESGPNHTAASNEPITMSEFLRLEIQVYSEMSETDRKLWDNKVKAGCWILDDSDTAENGGGWAYWSQPLAPDTATNLLLDKVSPTAKTPADDWIYRIDVKLQAVSENDLDKWNDTESTVGYKTSDAAQILINNVLKAG